MTWITDSSGTRWVEPAEKKRRASPRPLRFADLKAGDQLMRAGYRGAKGYYVVTDLWFDPVQGQKDPMRGSMVGYQHLGPSGEPIGRKSATTLRGLASQQFNYADIDYVAQCGARTAAVATGDVVPIGFGKVIRKRPKVPSTRF